MCVPPSCRTGPPPCPSWPCSGSDGLEYRRSASRLRVSSPGLSAGRVPGGLSLSGGAGGGLRGVRVRLPPFSPGEGLPPSRRGTNASRTEGRSPVVRTASSRCRQRGRIRRAAVKNSAGNMGAGAGKPVNPGLARAGTNRHIWRGLAIFYNNFKLLKNTYKKPVLTGGAAFAMLSGQKRSSSLIGNPVKSGSGPAAVSRRTCPLHVSLASAGKAGSRATSRKTCFCRSSRGTAPR